MFLTVFFEVILLAILIGGSYYGYNKGFFVLAIRPAKAVLRVGAAFCFCVPLGEAVILPLVAPLLYGRLPSGITSYVAGIISAGVAFLVILVLSGVLLSVLFSVLNYCASSGLIGRVNSLFGLIFAGIISVVTACFFVIIADIAMSLEPAQDSRLVKEFSGGPLYSFFSSISSLDYTYPFYDF
nr:hypothetical protein [Oscillospiraceae bacterium]